MSQDPLAILRGIFWDEVEDALETLEREGLTSPPRETLDADATRARFDEAYRLMHSLKGAARAVGYTDVETLCHTAEERLGKQQRTGELAGFEAEVARVTDVLHLALVDARAGALPSPPPKAKPARDQMDIERAHPPARDSSDLVDAAAADAPFDPSDSVVVDHASRGGEETIRVPVARLGRLVRASESVVEEIARGDDEVRSLGHLDQTLLEVVVELSKARRVLRASDSDARAEAQRRIEAALDALRSLSGWSVERRAAGERSRSALAGSGREVASEARALRMVPLATLGPALERAVADAGDALGKQVELRFDHGDVELDRKVRDGLREPLLHAVRNAVDHGIEDEDRRRIANKPAVGTLRIRAEVAGGELALVVEDDGDGVDEEALRAVAIERGVDVSELAGRELLGLLFRPGWSTRGNVNAFSGRGVGLDVVRQRIAGLHGRVDIETSRGKGTKLHLQVPIDLSATRLVMFALADAKLALVTTSVERLVRVQPTELRDVGNQLYISPAGGSELVPLVDLGATLGFGARPFARGAGADASLSCVVLAAGDRRVALIADVLLEERDAVVIPLGSRVRSAPFVIGATLLGDGEMALVLDADEIASAAVRATRELQTEQAARRVRRVLLVDDSVTTLQLERTLLESAGYEVVTAPDGEQAWRHLEAGEVFDVLVSDIEMPRLDGLSLSARVRKDRSTATLPIVLVTGLAQSDHRQRAMEIGVNAYIVKGRFDEDELLGVLEQLT